MDTSMLDGVIDGCIFMLVLLAVVCGICGAGLFWLFSHLHLCLHWSWN